MRYFMIALLFRFMTNLQCEVVELEFLEFSKGMQTISEEDFARILLRYTSLDPVEIGVCLDRVRSRMPEEKVLAHKTKHVVLRLIVT